MHFVDVDFGGDDIVPDLGTTVMVSVNCQTGLTTLCFFSWQGQKFSWWPGFVV